MAHNLEYNVQRGTHSFYSRKELAWHRLGQVIENAVTPDEALKLANLDFEVALAPIWSNFIPEGMIAGTKDLNGFPLYDKSTNTFTGKYISKKGALIKDKKSVYRTDTLENLGTVGNIYTPVQNRESINFIYNILKYNPDIKNHDDIIIETAGALGHGERIFVTAKLPTGFRIGEEKDDTELYIVFTNSHNGLSSLTAMVTPVRVVCNNTLSAALGNNKSKFKFRHTSNIHNSLKEGLSLLRISYDNFEANKEVYNALLHIKVDSKMVDDLIFRSMLPQDVYLEVKKVGIDNIDPNRISTRLSNQMLDMRNYVDFGVGQKTNRGTAYWAYMGINSYLNNGVNYKDYSAKFDGLIDGRYSNIDNVVLQNALQLG